jgi:hypothetical protein
MSVLTAVPIVILLVVEVPMLLYGLTRLRTAVQLRRNDPADIQTVRTASDGVVEFTGMAAELDGRVEGKYSGQECLAYSWVRKEKQSNGTYTSVDRGAEGEPFLVRDETGEVAVDPAGTLNYGDSEKWNPEPDVRQIEERIEAGDRLHVYGHKRDVVERRDNLGTESIYIGSETHDMSRLEKIRARPHLFVGHLLGLSSDLHITLGDESDAVKRFGIIGGFFTAVGLIGVVLLGVVVSAALA